MKKITVNEMVTALEGVLVNLESVDGYGVSVNMTKARVTYDGDFDEITFTSGNHNYDGIASISYNVADCIEVITLDEDNGTYTIEFSQYMSDILISTTKIIRKAV